MYKRQYNMASKRRTLNGTAAWLVCVIIMLGIHEGGGQALDVCAANSQHKVGTLGGNCAVSVGQTQTPQRLWKAKSFCVSSEQLLVYRVQLQCCNIHTYFSLEAQYLVVPPNLWCCISRAVTVFQNPSSAYPYRTAVFAVPEGSKARCNCYYLHH